MPILCLYWFWLAQLNNSSKTLLQLFPGWCSGCPRCRVWRQEGYLKSTSSPLAVAEYVQLCWTAKAKGSSDLSPGAKLMVLITSCWSSVVYGVGWRLLVFIKQPVSDPMQISSLGMGNWRKCLFRAVVLSTQTLSSLFRNIAHFVSPDLLGFFSFFLVLGKEPRFGFGGVWLPPDNLWRPPACGRSHFWKVSENNSHDPFHSSKRLCVFIL